MQPDAPRSPDDGANEVCQGSAEAGAGGDAVYVVERHWQEWTKDDWQFSGVYADLDSARYHVNRTFDIDLQLELEQSARIGVEQTWLGSVTVQFTKPTVLDIRIFKMIPVVFDANDS